MTPHDAPRFFAAIAKLAVMHRIEFDKAMGRLYYEALADIPIDVLEAALDFLVKHAGEWFPKTEEIRSTCDLVSEEVHKARVQDELRALPPPAQEALALEGTSAQVEEKILPLPGGPMTVKVRHDVSGYHCDRCEDTGYMKVCRCEDASRCNAHGRRMDDDYCPEYMNGRSRLPVRRCVCYETNPELLRRRALAAQAPKFTGPKRPRKGRD